MAIDRNWQVKVDYTQTYAVTADELNPWPDFWNVVIIRQFFFYNNESEFLYL